MDSGSEDFAAPDFAARAREHVAACDDLRCERQRSVKLMQEAWSFSERGFTASHRHGLSPAIAHTVEAVQRVRLAANCFHAEPQAAQDNVYLLDNLLTHLLASDDPEHVAKLIPLSSEVVELQAEMLVQRLREFGRAHPATLESLEVLDDMVARRARARERAGLPRPGG